MYTSFYVLYLKALHKEQHKVATKLRIYTINRRKWRDEFYRDELIRSKLPFPYKRRRLVNKYMEPLFVIFWCFERLDFVFDFDYSLEQNTFSIKILFDLFDNRLLRFIRNRQAKNLALKIRNERSLWEIYYFALIIRLVFERNEISIYYIYSIEIYFEFCAFINRRNNGEQNWKT